MINKFKDIAKEDPKRIVLPEGSDERILQAAEISAKERIAYPILLGDENTILEKASNFYDEFSAGFNLLSFLSPLLLLSWGGNQARTEGWDNV